MGSEVNLKEVNASVLPARVLVLLSKYAQTMRKHTGLVIKISSMNVFRHVHNTHRLSKHPDVTRLYKELLKEVNMHIAQGTMQTNSARQAIEQDRVVQQSTGLQQTKKPATETGNGVMIGKNYIVRRRSDGLGYAPSLEQYQDQQIQK